MLLVTNKKDQRIKSLLKQIVQRKINKKMENMMQFKKL